MLDVTRKSEIIISTVDGFKDVLPKPVRFENLEAFGNALKTPRVGGLKNGPAFIRGNCVNGRTKKCMHASKLLVIDADHRRVEKGESSCTQESLCNALRAMDINFISYTSYSNDVENSIWRHRAIIECTEFMEEKDLEKNIDRLYKKLWDHGVDIGYAKEVRSWTQIWYMPNVRKEEDWGFDCYYEGRKWTTRFNNDTTPPGGGLLTSIGDSAGGGIGDTKYSTKWSEKIENITTGEEIHESSRDISHGMINDGLHKAMVEDIMMNLYSQIPEKHHVRRDRSMRELPGLIDGAVAKKNSGLNDPAFSTPVIKEYNIGDMPLPPELMGQLFNQCREMQRYRNDKIAMVSTIGMLSGIVGRKFNVIGTGLNLYQMLAADTGTGKDFLTDFIYKTMDDVSDDGKFKTYIGSGRFTSPKSVYGQLESNRSCICVIPEAGLNMGTQNGDPAGYRRWLLTAYARSGKGQMMAKESYANKENDMIELRSPALSIASESTPDNLLAELSKSNSASDGFIARHLMYRVDERRPPQTMNPRRVLDNHLLQKITSLCETCYDTQGEGLGSKIHSMNIYDIQKEAEKYSGDVDNLYHMARDAGDVLKVGIAARMYVNTIKLAAIATIFNKEKCLDVGHDEFEWAVRFMKWQWDHIQQFMTGGGLNTASNDVSDIAYKVGIAVFKMIGNPHDDAGKKGQQTKLTHDQAEKRIIPDSTLKQKIGRSAAVVALNSDVRFTHLGSGYKRLTGFMINEGYFTKLDYDPTVGKGDDVDRRKNKVFYRVDKSLADLVESMQ